MEKILMINTVYNKGGAASIARTLHNALNENYEFFSYFAYGREKKVNDDKVFKFTTQLEVCFHAFLTRMTGLQGYGSWFSTKRLERFILKEKFDLIHLHNLHGYYLNLSFIKFLVKLKIPIIWTLHDGWPLTGRCAYFFECNRWKTGCGNCPNLRWYPKTYFDSSSFMWKKKKECFTYDWKPIIVCPSQWLVDRIRESYLDKYQIEVISNGVDTSIFKPKNKLAIREKLEISSAKKVILFIAAKLSEERKGAKYFFEAFKYITTKNWMVITLGKKLDFDTEITKNIDIKQLGYISDPNLISEAYSAADICCTTSLDESFGLTIAESMACGTPVVGFRVGGIPEQVTKDCGILIEPKDVKGLAEAINELLNDDEKQNRFSLNCRNRALQNYSIEQFKERYLNLYKSLLV